MPFNEQHINQVWEKGLIVPGYNPAHIRKDACGAWIVREHYANFRSPFGWVIDHICPQSMLMPSANQDRSADDIINLRPLQWRNNITKANHYPQYTAAVTSRGNINIRGEYFYEISADVQRDIISYYYMNQ